MGAGVAQSRGRSLPLADQVKYLVAEVGRARADGVAVAPPAVPAGRLPAERPAEAERDIERGVDGRVVPLVPQLAVERLDQPGNMDSHRSSIPSKSPARPAGGRGQLPHRGQLPGRGQLPAPKRPSWKSTTT